MNDEVEHLPISWIEHFSYCERQWALIALECVFDDNEATVRGHLTHRIVDEGGGITRAGVRAERSLPIWSHRLGLYGVADVVEFRGQLVHPVEYKAGRRAERPAHLQLTAQAMCLEEMLGVQIDEGSIYLAGARSRVPVPISEDLRSEVEAVAARIRQAAQQGRVPRAVDDPRCVACSLNGRCLPSLAARPRRVSALARSTFVA